MGEDFMLGFFSDLAGGEMGELGSKYILPKIGKGLLNKFHLPYKTVASWLGGGLETISKTFYVSGAPGGSITANFVMRGFAPNRVAVIGRNFDKRVVPFANYLSNELGFTARVWGGFNPSLDEATNLANNKAWIRDLLNQGYTIYDIGLDPDFVNSGGFESGHFLRNGII